jgi:predicted adenylyl cyclase CyaB
VNKKRILFVYKNTRIHLDAVEGLGDFVELETVFSTTLSQSEGIKEHDEVVKLLNLHRFPTIKGSYSGLLKTKII